MNEDGKAAAEEEVVAEQNDEVVVEATEEEHWQGNPRYRTTTNTPTKRTWPWPMVSLSSMKALEMLVVLRMNQNFMAFLRENHFLKIEALQLFNVAVVVPDIEEAEGVP
jgi:hypothetical protein